MTLLPQEVEQNKHQGGDQPWQSQAERSKRRENIQVLLEGSGSAGERAVAAADGQDGESFPGGT